MKIVILGNEVTLRQQDVAIAKKVLDRFMNVIKNGSIDNNMPTLYLTVLAVMKVRSEEMLNSLDLSEINKIISLLNNK